MATVRPKPWLKACICHHSGCMSYHLCKIHAAKLAEPTMAASGVASRRVAVCCRRGHGHDFGPQHALGTEVPGPGQAASGQRPEPCEGMALDGCVFTAAGAFAVSLHCTTTPMTFSVNNRGDMSAGCSVQVMLTPIDPHCVLINGIKHLRVTKIKVRPGIGGLNHVKHTLCRMLEQCAADRQHAYSVP